jgi:hypothetical protein
MKHVCETGSGLACLFIVGVKVYSCPPLYVLFMITSAPVVATSFTVATSLTICVQQEHVTGASEHITEFVSFRRTPSVLCFQDLDGISSSTFRLFKIPASEPLKTMCIPCVVNLLD